MDKKTTVEIKERLGEIRELMGDNLDKAILELEKINPKTLFHDLQTEYYYLAGDIHYDKDDFDDAIIFYNLALKGPHLEKEDRARVYGNLAFIYCEKELYKETIGYADKAIELSSDLRIISGALDRIALCYQNMGNHKQSIRFLLRILELYHEKRIDNWSKYMIESAYASLCFAYWKEGYEEKSEYYFQKITLFKDADPNELKRAYLCKAHRLYEKRQWKEALDHYNKATSMMENEEDKQHYQKYIDDCKGWLAKVR